MKWYSQVSKYEVVQSILKVHLHIAYVLSMYCKLCKPNERIEI